MYEQKNTRLQWDLFTAFSLLIFIIIPQSCSNVDNYEKSTKISENLISLAQSYDIKQFTPKAKMVASKFSEYTNTLSDKEFSELMNNLNNDEYMLTVIKDANIEAELQSIEKEINAIHHNFEYMDLDNSDKLLIFSYLNQ